MKQKGRNVAASVQARLLQLSRNSRLSLQDLCLFRNVPGFFIGDSQFGGWVLRSVPPYPSFAPAKRGLIPKRVSKGVRLVFRMGLLWWVVSAIRSWCDSA